MHQSSATQLGLGGLGGGIGGLALSLAALKGHVPAYKIYKAPPIGTILAVLGYAWCFYSRYLYILDIYVLITFLRMCMSDLLMFWYPRLCLQVRRTPVEDHKVCKPFLWAQRWKQSTKVMVTNLLNSVYKYIFGWLYTYGIVLSTVWVYPSTSHLNLGWAFRRSLDYGDKFQTLSHR
jgi:hypothetical protein